MRDAELPSSLKRGAAARMQRIDLALEAFYGTPEQELGNQADPLDEAVYIILSFQTDLPRLQATWKDLRAAYPTWRRLQRAGLPAIASAIRAGGLQEQKASRIRSLLFAVKEQMGSLSLAGLQELDDSEAERVLTRLPGLSWKGARCVMLYSLGRPSFPVDGNIFRICKRTGVIVETAVYRRRELHDRDDRQAGGKLYSSTRADSRSRSSKPTCRTSMRAKVVRASCSRTATDRAPLVTLN